ncbi:MAG: hypothetical protein AAB776_01275 [Patescibacteria group bacterium]
MSEQRLILPKRPRHHQHRLLAALALGGLVVAGVWGLQMKMTFDRFATERQAADTDNAFTQARDSLRNQEEAAEIRESMSALQELVSDMTREQVAKDEILDQVTEGMKEEMEGEVAGETIEAN